MMFASESEGCLSGGTDAKSLIPTKTRLFRVVVCKSSTRACDVIVTNEERAHQELHEVVALSNDMGRLF